MTITSIHKLPSGKTGATITSNLDELAILRGLVVNALRHMPDVGETTSTRQRLKAMSRVLHRVYTQEKPRVWVATTWITSPDTRKADNGVVLRGKYDKEFKKLGAEQNKALKEFDAEQDGNTRAQVKKAVECLKTAGCNSILKGMPDRFTYQEFADRVVKSGLTTEHEAREILVSLLNGSKEWMTSPVERVVKRVGVVHRRPLNTILDGMPTQFPRTQFIDEALDHGYTADQATKFLAEWLDGNKKYELDAATDTVYRRGIKPFTGKVDTLVAYADPKYRGTPVVCGPTVLPLSDQKSLMSILSEMPGEFTFSQFYNQVLHALKAVNAAMHGTVTKEGEAQLRNECNDFLMRLPRNVFEVDGLSESVKRKGSVAVTDQDLPHWIVENRGPNRAERDWIDRHRGTVDPKSIPNPDYVSPAADKRPPLEEIFQQSSKEKGLCFDRHHFHLEALRGGWTVEESKKWMDVKLGPLPHPPAFTHPNNSTDLNQTSVPEELRCPVESPYVPVQPPAGATKLPAHRTTLFEVYDQMDKYFTFGTLSNRAEVYGNDRPKVSAFVSLMCKIGSLRQMGGSIGSPDAFLYEKLSSVTSPDMRHLASLIA